MMLIATSSSLFSVMKLFLGNIIYFTSLKKKETKNNRLTIISDYPHINIDLTFFSNHNLHQVLSYCVHIQYAHGLFGNLLYTVVSSLFLALYISKRMFVTGLATRLVIPRSCLVTSWCVTGVNLYGLPNLTDWPTGSSKSTSLFTYTLLS